MKRLALAFSLMFLLPFSVRAETPAAAEAPAGKPPVFISEIAWAGSSVSTADEWLELFNPGGDAIDLSGWMIEGAGTGGSTLTFPTGSSISASSTFLITNYAAGDPHSSLNAAPDWTTTSVALSNSALHLMLRDAGGGVIDEAGASGTPPFAGTSGETKTTMERVWPIAAGTSPEAWRSSASDLGSPGFFEITEISADLTEAAPPSDSPAATETPSAEPDPLISAVRLSEVYPSPASGEEEWIELVNPSGMGEVLNGWGLTDARGTVTALEGVILPWGRMVIRSPKGSLNNDGDVVTLFDQKGRIVDRMSYGKARTAEEPHVETPKRGESAARLELSDEWRLTNVPTLNMPNIFPAPEEEASVPPPPARSVIPETQSVIRDPESEKIILDSRFRGNDGSPSVIPHSMRDPEPEKPILDSRFHGNDTVATNAIVAKKASAPPVKKPAKPKYKGDPYVGTVASPPGVYSKTRMYALIGEEVREVRLSKASNLGLAAGGRISFTAQAKEDAGSAFLLANPNSIRRLDASASATFASVEDWPEQSGAYRFSARIVSFGKNVLTLRLGNREGELKMPDAKSKESLREGDVIAVSGFIGAGERPIVYMTGGEPLTLIKGIRVETGTGTAPTPKLPAMAAALLTACAAGIGLLAYLRHQRLQRLILTQAAFEEET